MISVYFNGRLGNQIYQYLATRVSARINNCNFWVPKNAQESIIFYSSISRRFGVYLELPCETNPHYWVGENLFEIDYGVNDGLIEGIKDEADLFNVSNNTFLCGYYQTDKYYLDREFIKEILKIKADLKSKAEHLVNRYSIDEYCYIHFRGGDYVDIKKWFLPKKYYIDAIDRILIDNPNIKFVIITDDYNEAKSFFPEYDIISNNMEIDFYLLYNSLYSIIPNSSFSWWACWLNDNKKITIAPNKWLNYNNDDIVTFEPIDIKTSRFTYINK